MEIPVYQRGWVINSQLGQLVLSGLHSISKGMGDQFAADRGAGGGDKQYIKGDG